MYPYRLAGALLQVAETPSLADYVTAGRVAAVLTTLAFAWLLIYGIAAVLDFLSSRVARARFFFKRIEPFARIGVWFVAVYVILSTISPTEATFWAGLGSIAIALGLGAQDLIRNLLGGVVILTDRPFQLGDRVRIGDAYGEIDHIGLGTTKLTTPDDTRVTIPNSQMLTNQVFNANSGVPSCQVVTDVYLPSGSNPDEAARIAEEVAYASPYLLLGKPVVVLVSDHFAQRPYLRIRIKAYVHDHRFEPQMQSDITIRAKREFIRRGMVREEDATGRPKADQASSRS